MTGFLKQIVRIFLGYFDLELRRINSPCRSFNIGVKNLGQLFRPRTVIDVGAAQGTPDLYKHFSGAQFLLIEPLKVFETALQSMRDKFGAIVEKGCKPYLVFSFFLSLFQKGGSLTSDVETDAFFQ